MTDEVLSVDDCDSPIESSGARDLGHAHMQLDSYWIERELAMARADSLLPESPIDARPLSIRDSLAFACRGARTPTVPNRAPQIDAEAAASTFAEAFVASYFTGCEDAVEVKKRIVRIALDSLEMRPVEVAYAAILLDRASDHRIAPMLPGEARDWADDAADAWVDAHTGRAAIAASPDACCRAIGPGPACPIEYVCAAALGVACKSIAEDEYCTLSRICTAADMSYDALVREEIAFLEALGWDVSIGIDDLNAYARLMRDYDSAVSGAAARLRIPRPRSPPPSRAPGSRRGPTAIAVGPDGRRLQDLAACGSSLSRHRGPPRVRRVSTRAPDGLRRSVVAIGPDGLLVAPPRRLPHPPPSSGGY